MSGRNQSKLARDDAGYEERIRRANARTIAALGTSLAQDQAVLDVGTECRIEVQVNSRTKTRTCSMVPVNPVGMEPLGYLATQLRPFQLKNEAIYHVDVVKGLRRFADTEHKRTLVEQLPRLWRDCLEDRMRTFVGHADHGELIPGGVGDVTVADRVLYSQVVHADDASGILQYIDTEWQRWSLGSLVGNWAAMASHQQQIMHYVRPDVVPGVTTWAGNPRTIFDRLGAELKTSSGE